MLIEYRDTFTIISIIDNVLDDLDDIFQKIPKKMTHKSNIILSEFKNRLTVEKIESCFTTHHNMKREDLSLTNKYRDQAISAYTRIYNELTNYMGENIKKPSFISRIVHNNKQFTRIE
jgi:adenosine deaminase